MQPLPPLSQPILQLLEIFEAIAQDVLARRAANADDNSNEIHDAETMIFGERPWPESDPDLA